MFFNKKETNQAISEELNVRIKESDQLASDINNMTRQEAINYIEMETHVGKPIIVIGNNWDNPLIGVGIKIDLITQGNCPILVVKDYITDQEYITFGKIFHYTQQRFEAIMKLDPNERWALISDNRHPNTNQPTDVLLTKEEIMEILIENNFPFPKDAI